MLNKLVLRHYECADEAARLWGSPGGELTRLRTWDILDRFLGAAGRIADIGGGPGVHAARLASLGYDVVLVEPVPRHVEQAHAAALETRFAVVLSDARQVPLADSSCDASLLLGPRYHLTERTERLLALREAWRVLRPGGRLLAEVITRHVWIIDATSKGLLKTPDIWQTFEQNLCTGLSNDPDRVCDGVFWAYFHSVEEVQPELEEAGLGVDHLVAVEGFAWTMGNLGDLLQEPKDLLRSLRLTEGEPSMLGASAHVIAVATKPLTP